MLVFLGAIFAWCCGYTILAVIGLFVSLMLSCLFEAGQREMDDEDKYLE